MNKYKSITVPEIEVESQTFPKQNKYIEKLNKDVKKTIEKIELKSSPRVFEPLQRIDEQTLEDFNKQTQQKVKIQQYSSIVSGVASNTSSILDKMKSRIAEAKSSQPDGFNELNFANSHRFDFMRSENLGGVNNMRETVEYNKREILARNQNFT